MVGVVEVELIRAAAKAADALKLADMVAFDAVLGAHNFVFGGGGLAQQRQFFVDYRFDVGEALPGVGGNLDEEFAGDFLGVVVHAHIAGDLALIYKPFVQARTFAVAKDGGEYL